MKTLIATTALALTALAGAASASVDTTAIQSYAPNADISQLSQAEVNTLLSVIHSGDSESEKRATVQALLQ
ncbi:hypothetical protein [Marivita hallyeonensis]|uniref:Uncharacterized protein n=1 Tax=Marivita hallyeonensis TaxID=996342 RepID=A0A1M5U573_9RHOB|nr:hypothetical protein [Marivita hallyeonensis]SHH58006.1 hypothetical protein SAMN05443551_2489 [Marivita hallyeonensis]SHI08070.1 hypothetical protein SAMN05443551_0146 [Marivita hallyeonensis]